VLIPSIDLKNGRVVQLVQGEKLALADDDLDAWIARFSTFPKVQLIDLDAAMGLGHNDALVRKVAAALPVRVGGGVRTVGRAEDLLAAGAHAVIVSSSWFNARAPGGSNQPPPRLRRSAEALRTKAEDPPLPTPAAASTGGGGPLPPAESLINFEFAEALAETIGADRIIAAVDSKAGRVVIHGWKTMLPISAVDAARMLEPYCSEFLYTHVDKEGLMQGTDLTAIRAVRDVTTRRVTAAGGITTREEIDALHEMGVDAVVGMAIYTGKLSLDRDRPA